MECSIDHQAAAAPDGLPDEEVLIGLAQTGSIAARDSLFARYKQQIDQYIHSNARLVRSSGAEVEDAQQDAALLFLFALAKYGPRPARPGQPSPFALFLRGFIRLGFGEFLRRVRKRKSRSLNGIDVDKLATSAGDAAAIADWKEQMELLDRTVMDLEINDRCAWFELKLGIPAKAVARDWGMTSKAFYGLRRRLLARLKAQVNPSGDECFVDAKRA
jgi:hypothetical protein